MTTNRNYQTAFDEWLSLLADVYEQNSSGITIIGVKLGYIDGDPNKIEPALVLRLSDGSTLAASICDPIDRFEAERRFLSEVELFFNKLIEDVDRKKQRDALAAERQTSTPPPSPDDEN